VSFYPTLKDDQILTLQIVVKSIEKDAGYLDSSDCPYSDVIKDFFRKISRPEVLAVDLFENRDDIEVLDEQIQKVLSDLERMGPAMLTAETNERLAYFKAKTTLLEKLVNMKERVFNLKEMNDFRNIVISTIETVSTKDQIAEFMKNLDGVLGTGQDQ
jgi:hypothetical protein